MFNRVDLSVMQDVFKNIGGKRNAGQIRLDITNFGNLLNQQLGRRANASLPQRLPANGAQILTNPAADAQGRADLPPGGRQQRADSGDVPDRHRPEQRLPVPA